MKKLDDNIDASVTSLKDIQWEIKKIKFHIANFSTLYPLSLKDQKPASVKLFKTKRLLKEKRDALKKDMK